MSYVIPTLCRLCSNLHELCLFLLRFVHLVLSTFLVLVGGESRRLLRS